jgi:hypothetical protein
MRPRSQNNSKAANIPVEDNKPEIEIAVPPDSNPAVEAYQKEIKQADEAALALKKQIDQLHSAENYQRQRMEQEQQARLMRQARLQDMRPPSREQKIEAWKQAGLSAANEAFMWEHPELIDHHEVTRYATQEALASGVKPDSDDFRSQVKARFDSAMRRLQAESEVEHGPTPAFFAPPPPKPASEPAVRSAAMVSAPVSREIPSHDRAVSIPSRVSLSAEERQIAAASGISDKEYAANKLRMMRMKQTGEIQT